MSTPDDGEALLAYVKQKKKDKQNMAPLHRQLKDRQARLEGALAAVKKALKELDKPT
jgi:hypothetical protein